MDFKNFKENHPYLAKCFNKKTLIAKGIILLCALVLVWTMSLSFYFWLCDKPIGTLGQKNSFWYLDIQWNSGIGWSALRGNTAAIYAIQAIVFVMLSIGFVFVANGKICASFVALAMFGGLFNLIQRAATPADLLPGKVPAVLDYFKFGFWESFPTFNWPDMFVVIGVFGFVISYIIYIILQAKREELETDDDMPSQPTQQQTQQPIQHE